MPGRTPEDAFRSEFTQRALLLGKAIKHYRRLQWRILSKLNIPLKVSDSFGRLEFTNLRITMEDVLCLTLPPGTVYVSAERYDATLIKHVFYGECTYQDCTCGGTCLEGGYCFLSAPSASRKRYRSLSWKQLDAMLFLVEMHTNIVDMSANFLERAKRYCRENRILSASMLKTLDTAIAKERRSKQTKLKAMYDVSSRARVRWLQVRRWVCMYHYAHKLWEYKFSSRVAQLDKQHGVEWIQQVF